MRLIDPPSRFASLQEWQQFLDELLIIADPEPEVNEAITEARAVIAEKTANADV